MSFLPVGEFLRELLAESQPVSAPPAGPRRRKQLERGKGFAVNKAQREAIDGQFCLVCAQMPVEPAHLIDRSLCNDQADPRAVVPLCPVHHRQYDDHDLDLLPYLEPRFRVELGFAVERFGLLSTLNRVTGLNWSTA